MELSSRSHWTSSNKLPLINKEDNNTYIYVFEDDEAGAMDLDVGEDDDDTEYEDASHVA